MTTDAKDTEVPSTSAPLPEAAAPETKVEAAPIVDKGGDTPAAPPAASAKETPASVEPKPVLDDNGIELSPEEQETMARLTGQDTKKKDEAPAAEKPAAEAPKTPEAPAAPVVETAEEIGGIKLPTSHELAGYKPETRKRIEQFTKTIKEAVPLADSFTGLVDGFRAVGVTPEQFHAWQDLGIELRSKDPGVRKAALDTLHDLAVKTGLKVEAPEPDNTAVLAKIQELEKSLDIEPAHAEALRAALAAKPAKQPAPPPANPAPVNQPDPRQMVQEALMQDRIAQGKYSAQEALAEAAAKLPVADHETFQQEVIAEVAKLEASLQNNPAELNNTLKWGARMRTAANIVLSRRNAANTSQTRLPTQSLRSTTPNAGQTDDPQPGTEEYELGILTGKIQVKR